MMKKKLLIFAVVCIVLIVAWFAVDEYKKFP